jgi:hypothetical protein
VSIRRLSRCAVLALTLACTPDAPRDAGNPWLTDSDFVVAGLPDDADSSEILTLLGEPDSIISIPDPDEPDIELLAWIYPDLAVALADDGLRFGITLTGPGAVTSRGLRTGDSATRVLDLYGRPPRRVAATWDYIATDDPNGLHVMRVGFEGERVSWIFLGWLLE